jgi:hypothetical protein
MTKKNVGNVPGDASFLDGQHLNLHFGLFWFYKKKVKLVKKNYPKTMFRTSRSPK